MRILAILAFCLLSATASAEQINVDFSQLTAEQKATLALEAAKFAQKNKQPGPGELPAELQRYVLTAESESKAISTAARELGFETVQDFLNHEASHSIIRAMNWERYKSAFIHLALGYIVFIVGITILIVSMFRGIQTLTEERVYHDAKDRRIVERHFQKSSKWGETVAGHCAMMAILTGFVTLIILTY